MPAVPMMLIPLIPLLIAGTLIFWNHAHAIMTWPGLERLIVSSLIDRYEENYLIRMRDTHLGCKTIQHRRPDIVFIGDSHSYAGYDYAYLQSVLRPARVGNCALSGLRPVNVLDFLSAAKGAGLLPRHLVFGISPEMFWYDEDRRINLAARSRREIAKINAPKESVLSLASGRFRNIEDFRRIEQTRSELETFEKAIGALDARSVDLFLAGDTSGIYPFDWWKDTVRKSTPDHQLLTVIEDICRAAKRNDVVLGIVYVPESEWLLSRFTDQQRQAFMQVTKRFAACANWSDFRFFPGGAPNNWFVNRYLLSDYPYGAWRDVALARDWIAEAPQERRWQFFDPDHMNSQGAKQFSHIVANLLADQILDGKKVR